MRISLAFLLLTLKISSCPTDPIVMEGQAEFSQEPGCLQISSSDRTIVHWKDFSIRAGEAVHFSQPDARSVVLNRVVGPNPSQLFGMLSSNGQVLLINPSGILIGKEAQIDTGSWIASTLDIQNDLFVKNGELSFSGDSPAQVRNQGSIRAKNDVCLIGAHVENQGSIESQNGLVGIVARGDVILKPSGVDRLFIKGHVLNDSENVFAQAFLPDDQLAEIGYVANSGSITGTWVGLSGGIVDVQEGSLIDVSSLSGGGTVLIGGDYQGKSSSFPNAKIASVFSGAKIKADALENGNGGKIIVWGDLGSQMAGTLSAQGGPFGGDGGFLEISSPGALNFLGSVNTFAPQGKAGSLLLDPAGVTIGAVSNGTWNPICPTGFIGNPAVVQILNTDLQTALGTCNVTIDTGTSSGAGTGDITVNSSIIWASASSLSLIANQDILVNPGIFIISGGTTAPISLTAARNITILSTIINNSVPPNPTLTLTSTGGSIVIGGAAQIAGVQVTSTLGLVTVTACQDVTIQGGNAGANRFTIVGSQNGPTSGDIVVSAGRNLSILAGIGTRSFAAITRLGDASVGSADGNVTVNVGNNLLIRGSPAFRSSAWIGLGGESAAGAQRRYGNITVNVGNDIQLQGGTGDASMLFNRAYIGSATRTTAALDTRCIITINVGRDLLMGTFPTVQNVSYIGGGGIPFDGYRQTGIINVGRNLIQDGRTGFASIQFINDGAIAGFPPSLTIHVGGDHLIIGGDNTTVGSGNGAIILYHLPTLTSTFMTEVFCIGNIVAINGTASSGCLHLANTTFATDNFGSFDARAGGDISPGGGTLPGSHYQTFGFVSYQSDFGFASGQLWTPATVPPVIVCGTNIFAATPFATNSPATSSEGFGAIRFDFNFYNTPAFNFGTLTAPLFSPAISSVQYIITGDLTMISSDQTFAMAVADLNIGSANGLVNFTTSGGNVLISGFNDIFINTVTTPAAAVGVEATLGSVLVSAQHDINLISGHVIAGLGINFVADQAFPNRPFIGTGSFNMDALSQADSGTGLVGIYTARQSFNVISPLALFSGVSIASIFSTSGLTFGNTTLFVDTLREIWCAYFSEGFLPNSPLTIFYKDCLQQATQQATIIIDEFLVDLHPYDEHPGWSEVFRMSMLIQPDQDDFFYADWPWAQNYQIWRRNLSLFNQPRYWTLILHKGRIKGDE